MKQVSCLLDYMPQQLSAPLHSVSFLYTTDTDMTDTIRRAIKLHPSIHQNTKDGWMVDLQFYVLFNSISVISGRCLDDNERLCAMELH